MSKFYKKCLNVFLFFLSASKVLVVAPKLFRCNEEERILITAFDIGKRIPFKVILEHATHGNLISEQRIFVSKGESIFLYFSN